METLHTVLPPQAPPDLLLPATWPRHEAIPPAPLPVSTTHPELPGPICSASCRRLNHSSLYERALTLGAYYCELYAREGGGCEHKQGGGGGGVK